MQIVLNKKEITQRKKSWINRIKCFIQSLSDDDIIDVVNGGSIVITIQDKVGTLTFVEHDEIKK